MSQGETVKVDRSWLSLLRLYHTIKDRQLTVKIELNFLCGELKSDSTKITGNVEKLLTASVKTG